MEADNRLFVSVSLKRSSVQTLNRGDDRSSVDKQLIGYSGLLLLLLLREANLVSGKYTHTGESGFTEEERNRWPSTVLLESQHTHTHTCTHSTKPRPPQDVFKKPHTHTHTHPACNRWPGAGTSEMQSGLTVTSIRGRMGLTQQISSLCLD